MLIDSHAHLNFSDYANNLDKIIADSKSAGVGKIINIGTSLNDSREGVEMAQKFDGLWATIGIHPNDNPQATEENIDWEEFERLAQLPKVVAIGECGLDYSRVDSEQESVNSREYDRQRKLFRKQIEIAQKLNLPLSIHIRNAQEDLMNIFAAELSGMEGVFHCFSGDQRYLEFILKNLPDFYISFAGNVTFNNAGSLQELAKLVPLDRMLVETDCPFLSPEPLRGKQNVPANVVYTAKKLAVLKEINFEEIVKITSENAAKLFKI